MDRLEYILNNIPQFTNKEEQDSKIRAIVKAFADEMALVDNQVDYVRNMIGIDGTTGTDIDNRWGSLTNINRKLNEDDTIYRNRIKTAITNLSGGTADSLKYCIAVAMGIDNNQSETDRRVKVYDAWLYDGVEQVTKEVGYVVITIDLDGGLFDYRESIDAVVDDAIAETKASGVNVQLIFTNYRVMTYAQMAIATYIELSAKRYNQIGDTV